MKLIFKLFPVLIFGIIHIGAIAQIKERERPKSWDSLVFGGRFMDRFLPIPVQGTLTYDTWGAKDVIPRYINNGIEDSINSYWGGKAVLGKDSKYHLFVCGWSENSPKGHMYWSKSTVFHTVSENSFGPYKIKDTIGHGHNPEVFQLKDGRYMIYVIDGHYISNSLDGPWEYGKFEFDNRDRKIIEGLSNLSFAKREDGSIIMVCRGGGIWFSKTGISPYNQVTETRVYPPVEGEFEDPVIWKTNVQYHMIVNDWLGRIAFSLRSKDGVNWKVDPGEAYAPGISNYEDGTQEKWFKYERIKMLQDKYGRATQAHFAVIDTVKWNDLQNDNHSSKHIIIPLTKGKLATILNKKKITAKTKTITVKIEAENDFNPHTDIDFNSLKFGATEQVNFGRGSKVVKTEKFGNDIIITFEGKGNGLTNDNFVAKIIGKTTDNKLLFSYARLPEINYIEPILSARMPKITKSAEGYDISVEIENFGQVDSQISKLKLVYLDNNIETFLVSAKVPKLKPFEKTIIHLKYKGKMFIGKETLPLKVIINPKNKVPSILHSNISLSE
ncbi:glycoside hydrolase family protein [Sabulilitoribacter arenilitoris]|uniref:Glycoside hydrolase family protein n=1 Tax=Wocania arenilitoris TaxID=2044858 RepID=A0AAE3ER42_9FLAO|nr:glycoside hydrolase family protein [Wocania arenilitoris]MCF7568849.1 glycoside hydrolase family protein [Wocania arenilitoris]